MFSYEDRRKAVELYIANGHCVGLVIKELGYPSPNALRAWHREYEETGKLKDTSVHKPHFSPEQIEVAVDHYFANGQSYIGTSRALGYPNRMMLAKWVASSGKRPKQDCLKSPVVVRYSQEEKQAAILEWVSGVPDYKIAAQRHISRATLYNWKKQFLPDRRSCPMPKKEAKHITADNCLELHELLEEHKALKEELAILRAEREVVEKQLAEARFEQDVIETTIRVLKKAEDINLETLTNREKVDVIDVLRTNYRLNILLLHFKISKSSYFYARNAKLEPDKYSSLRGTMRTLFEKNRSCYGYRRLHSSLQQNGLYISEKVVRRLMSEEGLKPYRPKQKKYSSYAGEIDGAPKNMVARNFHAETPNSLWLTDITEFPLPAGKVYLSPIVDCFDGMAVSWTIGCSPTAELANTMLEQAIDQLPVGAQPIIHSDRGGHYRWPKWVELVDKAKLTRSMSRKGCSPDNAACEGFFGRIKNEMFYGRSWLGVSVDAFIAELDDYLHWYNEDRIKLSLGAMSPRDYRQKLGLI